MADLAPPDAPPGDSREAPVSSGAGDAAPQLRLVATLLLEGKEDRARELAARLLEEGALSAPDPDAADGRARRALELLTGIWPDPEAALAVLGERPDSGDIAWPVARALALARAGESHEAAAAFEELARTLRLGAGLEVRHVRFARRVESFGVYEDDPREAFLPGASVLLYAELRGFVCEPATALEAPKEAEGGATEPPEAVGARTPDEAEVRPELLPETWRVRLEVRASLENFLTGEAGPEWDAEEIEHVTRARVRDLHVTRLVRLPADLPPGDYGLRIEVRDLAPGGAEGLGVRRIVVAGR
ncbi:MAG: hypothetical protein ACYTKD_02195 [Planctomycetota bacterium]|jgi:hypothetical protein